MTKIKNYKLIVIFDKKEKKITIKRELSNGSHMSYTSVNINKNKELYKNDALDKICISLGAKILLGSAGARNIFGVLY